MWVHIDLKYYENAISHCKHQCYCHRQFSHDHTLNRTESSLLQLNRTCVIQPDDSCTCVELAPTLARGVKTIDVILMGH